MLSDELRRTLIGHRVESFRVDILDMDDNIIGELDHVRSGEVNYSIFNTIRSGGSLEVDRATAPYWHKIRLQPWRKLTDPYTGQSWESPLGVFLPTTPKVTHDENTQSATVEMYDKLVILDQDKVGETWTASAGVPITDIVAQVIASAGETKMVIDDTDQTLNSPMVWEAGTSKLRIINDLLDAANYFSLWVDGRGVFRVDPYIAPGDRGVSWDFTNNEESIIHPVVDHNFDAFEVPNMVVLVATTEGDEEAMVSVATNENPDSPFSYQQRGRWITHFEEGVEATSQAALDNIAQRRLNELSQAGSTYDIRHAWIPPEILDLNNVVTVRYGEIDARCVVQKMSFSWEPDNPGQLVSTTIRELV